MENPATHGPAEKIITKVLNDYFSVTDPDDLIVGLSLEREITDALREAGLLAGDEPREWADDGHDVNCSRSDRCGGEGMCRQ